ncbi:TAXI family TRAP transporter solute-binding subunit [uncultured Desulfovibrio sp.]|uniref:TAXI family TRAP transporter solute-binding subunit n=1 Tax=uncultured Desulfovibrio sp. TaxID=167968 RepID=UPI00261F0D62|nr:TAXI family TRAP transporter solute-binding subunit [uncultured Desulfovibrio sp.]
MKKGLISLLVTVVMLAAGLAQMPQAAELKTFTITSGPLGGDFYALGGVIGEAARSVMPGATVSVNTGGSVENLLKIDAGKADLGTSMIKLYEESLKAEGVFASRKPVQNVKIMMYVAPMPMSFFLVRADSPYTSIADIANTKPKIRLLTSKKGSSPAVASENMLKQYGFSFEDIKEWGGSVSYVSYAEASSLIQDGHADAYVGPIVSSINELITTVKMKMLPIDQAVLDKLSSEGYMTYTIKAGQYYFITKDTPHMAETVVLPVGANLPDDAVYALTKVLCEKPEMIRNVHQTYSVFDPSKSADHIAVQYIHPGALRYYKEKGWVK